MNDAKPATAEPGNKAKKAHTLARWRAEKTAACLMLTVAEHETDASRQAFFKTMAEAAEKQAAILAGDYGATPEFRRSLRCRIVALVVRLVGPKRARALLAAMKVRGISVYSGRIEAGHPMPRTAAEVLDHRRADTSGALRAAVFGVSDGVVSNTCLILGVAGAEVDPHNILLTGVAGLLAGAFSMGAGEWVSMRSQRELYEHQIAQEREELERYPEEEAEELALIYNARGVPMDQARAFAKRLIANPDEALETLAREELGLNPDELGSPWGAAGSSFAAFSAGAVVPMLPFFTGGAANAVPVGTGLAGIALFGVGAALSLFSGKDGWAGGARMVIIGALAAGASFGIGKLLGVAVTG